LQSRDHNDESLDFLLAGVRDENQRKLVRSAYFAFASGDPNTFPVQFAVLLKAHALALRTAPTKLQRALTEERHKVSDALVAHRAYLESLSGSRPAGSEASNALLDRGGDLAAAISQIQNAIREQLREERNLFLEPKADSSSRAQPTTARLINRLAAHRIILALLLSYGAGLTTQPVFHYLFSFWKH
jgi:hypothetical protein